MIDFDKPIRTRDGRKVTIIATGLTVESAQALGSFGGMFNPDRDTVLAVVDGRVKGYAPDGSYIRPHSSDTDLVNFTPRVSSFLGFNSEGEGGYGRDMFCSMMEEDSLEDERAAPFENSDCILELIREDGKLVDVKFHPPEDTE